MGTRQGRRIAFKVFISVYVVVNLYGAGGNGTWSRK